LAGGSDDWVLSQVLRDPEAVDVNPNEDTVEAIRRKSLNVWFGNPFQSTKVSRHALGQS
jgi:hypothetical protein